MKNGFYVGLIVKVKKGVIKSDSFSPRLIYQTRGNFYCLCIWSLEFLFFITGKRAPFYLLVAFTIWGENFVFTSVGSFNRGENLFFNITQFSFWLVCIQILWQNLYSHVVAEHIHTCFPEVANHPRAFYIETYLYILCKNTHVFDKATHTLFTTN